MAGWAELRMLGWGEEGGQLSSASDHHGHGGSPGANKNDRDNSGPGPIGRGDGSQLGRVVVRARSGVGIALAAAARFRGQRPFGFPVDDHGRGEDAQGTHVGLHRGRAVPSALVPSPSAGTAAVAARTLLRGGLGRSQDLGEDLVGRVGRDLGQGRQPGGEEAFEAVLVAVTHHVRLTGGLGHDIAAVLLGEESLPGRLQQAIDAFFPFITAVGLWWSVDGLARSLGRENWGVMEERRNFTILYK